MQTPATASSSPIRDALYENEGNLNRLRNLIEQLEEKLLPVTAPQEAAKAANNLESPRPPASEYEIILRDQSEQMDVLGARLQTLLTYLAV